MGAGEELRRKRLRNEEEIKESENKKSQNLSGNKFGELKTAQFLIISLDPAKNYFHRKKGEKEVRKGKKVREEKIEGKSKDGENDRKSF